MNIIPTTSHPAWCDPRACTALLNQDGSPNYEHSSSAPALRPAAQPDAKLSVRLTQLDDRGVVPGITDVNGTLTVTDTSSSDTFTGGPRTISVDLDPMDLRMLAAQLVVVAEQVEALRLAERGTR